MSGGVGGVGGGSNVGGPPHTPPSNPKLQDDFDILNDNTGKYTYDEKVTAYNELNANYNSLTPAKKGELERLHFKLTPP